MSTGKSTGLLWQPDKIGLTKTNYVILYRLNESDMKEETMLEVTDNAIHFLAEMMEQMGGNQKVRLSMVET